MIRDSHRRLPRRSVLSTAMTATASALWLLAASLLAACGSSEAGATVTLAPAEPPRGEATPPRGATPPPAVDLRVALEPSQVGTGETLLVRAHAPAAASGTIEYRDGIFPMATEGDQLWAVLGVPLDEFPGERALAVTARGVDGQVLGSSIARYMVVPLARPVDQVALTAEQASVVTPEGTARELLLRSRQYAQFDRIRRWTGLFIHPTSGPITTQFGEGRSYNGGPVGSFHTGVDYGPPLGTPVIAAGAGRVTWTGEMPIRGRSVILDHGAGVKTGYHHLDVRTANVGDFVEAGTVIGTVGESGLATGPHLHWELSIWGVHVDPLTWLAVPFVP